MKSTGIFRRIDSLGRFVLPKELRKTLDINQNDYLQMVESNGIYGFEREKKSAPRADMQRERGARTETEERHGADGNSQYE